MSKKVGQPYVKHSDVKLSEGLKEREETCRKFKDEEITEDALRSYLREHDCPRDMEDTVVLTQLAKREEERLEAQRHEKCFLPYRCPNCASSQTYYRSKANTSICRQCGREWEREDLKKS